MRIAMKNIYDHKGAPVCVIGRISDINEEKQERDRLKNQAGKRQPDPCIQRKNKRQINPGASGPAG